VKAANLTTRYPDGHPSAIVTLLPSADSVVLAELPQANPAPQMTPGASGPMGLLLAGLLRNRWSRYVAAQRRLKSGFCATSVHELRVASRRLAAQLYLVSAVSTAGQSEKAYHVLKRSLKRLGRLRDMQVQRTFIESQLDAFPELILVRDYLEKRERSLAAMAATEAGSFKVRKFERRISAMLDELGRSADDVQRTEHLSAKVLRALRNAYSAVARRRRAIRFNDVATIHRTRVALKKLRYLTESLPAEITGFTQEQLASMARLQREMGSIQDLDVAQAFMRGFIAKYRASEELLRPFCRHLQRLRAHAVCAFMKNADALLEFRPAVRD
jgi:CHAD domain-containing protein